MAIKILLVDDNRDKDNFFEPLADLTSNHLKGELIQAHTFAEMKTCFDETPYEYQGVILDGKGQKDSNSSTEDGNFLTAALKYIRQKNQEGIFIPYVIYSGFADELKKFYGDENIYWKDKGQEKEMLLKLRSTIEDSEYYQSRELCSEVFEVFDYSLLASKYKPDLMKAAQVYADTFVGNREDVLRSLRPMLEATFSRLRALDEHLISPKYFKKTDPNISGIIWYLSGSSKYNPEKDEMEFHSERIMPIHLYYLTDGLKNITSSAAMHHYDKSSSKHLTKAAVNALFEYLIWYKNFAKLNYLG